MKHVDHSQKAMCSLIPWIEITNCSTS